MLHVTDILDANDLVDTTWMTDFGRLRGTFVHEAIALDIRGDLDDSALRPDVLAYVASWRRYLGEASPQGVTIVASELDVIHEIFRYCGRLDLVIRLGNGQLIVVDFKCGQFLPATGLQLCGYAMAYQAMNGGATPGRAGLYLKTDGRAAQLEQFTDRSDFDAWRGAVAMASFKHRNGLWEPKPREVA